MEFGKKKHVSFSSNALNFSNLFFKSSSLTCWWIGFGQTFKLGQMESIHNLKIRPTSPLQKKMLTTSSQRCSLLPIPHNINHTTHIHSLTNPSREIIIVTNAGCEKDPIRRRSRDAGTIRDKPGQTEEPRLGSEGSTGLHVFRTAWLG